MRDAEAGIAAAEREARETSERRNALQNERRKMWAAGDEADKAAAALKVELQRLEKRARAPRPACHMTSCSVGVARG